MRTNRSVLLLLLGLALAAVRSAAADDEPGRKKELPSPPTPTVEPYTCGTVQRIHTLDGVFLASQPQPADLEQAKAGGIRTVVSLRHADELDWDEAALVARLGMEHASIPFRTPDELTDDVFDRVRALLNDPAKRPLLLHCSSANRVGAVWLAHRVLDGGLSIQAAVAEARRVGLKLPAFEEKALDHVRRRQGR